MEGTTMIITLPMKKNEIETKKDKNIEIIIDMEQRDNALIHVKILLAEDNMINQKIYQRQLKNYVSLTYPVYDGQEALNKFFENIKFFDMILCDIHMPFYNGYEVADKIREVSKTPILFLSGEITIDKEELYKKYSPCIYLLKPVNTKELLNSIYKLVNHL
jgi:two-component system capsular synthesis sensor histidine kinase RcsC